MKKIIGKRALSLLLSMALLITQMGVPVFAAEVAPDASGLCEHHTEHTPECGYNEGAPCTHEHTEDCYRTETVCTFIASDEVDVTENTATPSEPPEQTEHECTEESGCITKTLDCKHEHDEACGFAEPSPCTYKCQICAAMDSGDVTIGVSSITVISFDELEEVVRQRTVPAGTELAALNLPTTLQATGYEIAEDTAVVDSGAAPITTPAAITIEGVTWELDPTNEVNNGNNTYDPAQGNYAFTPVLPEGYTLADGTALPEIWVMVGAPLLLAGDIPYIDENGDSQTATGATEITAETETLTNGWYYVPSGSSITRNSTITVNGNDVHLILTNGCDLTVTGGSNAAGINVSGDNALTIYGQSGGTGKLTATGGQYGAGIGGGSDQKGGNITINGGTVTTTGGGSDYYGGGAGIGGGSVGNAGGAGGTVTINGGTVTAMGGGDSGGGAGGGSGIGGGGAGDGSGGSGGSGGTVTINGGIVYANRGAGNYGAMGADIGGGGGDGSQDSGHGGVSGDGANVTISGGTVYATGTGIGCAPQPGGGKLGKNGTFSTGTNGNAFIVASSISHQDNKNNWSGAIFEGNEGFVYKTPTLESDATVPVDKLLTIPESTSLTLGSGVAITNKGNVYAHGTLATTGGSWVNEGIGWVFENADGAVQGLAPEQYTAFSSANKPLGDFIVSGGVVGVDVHYNISTRTLTVLTDKPLTIANTNPASSTIDKIVVADGVEANITLNGVNIDTRNLSSPKSGCPFTLAGKAKLNLTLAAGSDNKLVSSSAGLWVPKGAELTITKASTGSLLAKGGGGNESAAGIGGSNVYNNYDGGTITIHGGTVTAIGDFYAAGIGSARSGYAPGDITITGGTVSAFSNKGGSATSENEGGSIGGGSCKVTISGGHVTAYGIKALDADITDFSGFVAGGIRGTFATGESGNAFICTSAIQGADEEARKAWRGVIFEGTGGRPFTDATNAMTLPQNVSIPAGYVLTIPADDTLTFEGEVANSGAVNVSGTLCTTPSQWSNIDSGMVYKMSGGTITSLNTDQYIDPSDPTAEIPCGDLIVTGGGYGTNFTYQNNELTFLTGGAYNIRMKDNWTTSTKDFIVVKGGTDDSPLKLTLNSVKLKQYGTYNGPGKIQITANAVAELILVGDSVLTNLSEDSSVMLGVWSDAKLTLHCAQSAVGTVHQCNNQCGSLKVTNWQTAIGDFSSDGQNPGNITISGGRITATAKAGAGIGANKNKSGSKITIGGGIVTATGGACAGIGGCYQGAGGTITITGGVVNATSNRGEYDSQTSGAGIGGGFEGNGGNITISGGTVTARATADYNKIGGAGIGGGSGYNNYAGGTIIISGGTVTATGAKNAAGIGGGGGAVQYGGNGGNGGTLTISGGTVTAKGSDGGYGIGGGKGNGTNGTATILSIIGSPFLMASSIQDNADTSGWSGVIFRETSTGAIYGDSVALATDATIPNGSTLTIAQGKTLTINEGITLTNYGEIRNSGTINNYGLITPNAPIIEGGGSSTDSSEVAVTFAIKDAEGTPVTAAQYGQTVIITATAKKATSLRSAAAGAVDFYIGDTSGTKLGTGTVTGSGGVYTATLEVTLTGNNWAVSGSPYTITADFGGTTGLFGSKRSSELAVNIGDQAAPSVTAVAETFAGENDGKITGTTTAMEYSTTSTFNTTTACGGTEIIGLAPGTYYVRYKATDNYNAGAAATVTIAAGATRTYTLTVSAPTFTAATYGYSQPSAQNITITSTGNSNATITTVTVSGDAFVIGGSGGSVTAGSSINTWTVQPKASLNAGTHTATITVTYNNNMAATASVSFTVNNASQTAPSAPTQPSVGTATTHNSITINTASGQKYICTTSSSTPEISGGAGWTAGTGSANTFNGLTRNTTYYIWAYTAGDANYNDSAVSTALSVKTLEEPIASVNVLEITDPASNATPDTSAANGTGWTAGTVSWFMGATPLNGNFDYEKVYTAKVTLTAAEGYLFPDTVTAQVGGNGATVTDKSASNITVSYTYPATGAQGQTAAPGFANANYAMPTATATAATFALTGDTTNTTYKLYDQQAGGSEASTDVSISVSGSTLTLTFTAVPNADKTYYVSATKTDELESTRTAITVKTYVATTGIRLNKDTLSLTKGGSETLTATIAPDTATNQTATWTSSDSSIATVDASGKVTAVSAGTATITTKAADGQTAICTITVTVPPSPPSGGGDTGGGSGNSTTEPKPAEKYTVQNGALALDRSELQSLVNAGKSLIISDGKVTLVFDTAAIKAILDTTNGKVTFGINTANVSGFKDAKAAIGSRPVYSFTISVGGKTVPVNFGAGKVSVSIPYTPAKGESSGNLYAAYVDGNGKVEYITGSSYDQNSKAVIFNAPHFSTYGVAYKADAPQFTDITTHWAKADIAFVASRNLLTGTSKDKFSPDTGMTRGMFVTALGRLAGIDVNSYKIGKFTDVKADAYYAPYANWAASKGITSGTTATTFSPDKTITRQELATLMANYAKAMNYTLPKTRTAVTYADSGSIGSWAAEAVKAMQMAGVMNGKDGNKFDPNGTATRAEVSAVLHRYVELVVDPATAQGLDVNDSGSAMLYENGKPVKSAKRTVGGNTYNFNAYGEAAMLPQDKRYLTYTVQKGDSFWAISRKYKVNMFELAKLNDKNIFSLIRPGDVLKIPQ